MGGKTALLTWKFKRITNKVFSDSKVISVLSAVGLILLAVSFMFGVCWLGSMLLESDETGEAVTQTSEQINYLVGAPSATNDTEQLNETTYLEETTTAVDNLLRYALLIGMLLVIVQTLKFFRLD